MSGNVEMQIKDIGKRVSKLRLGHNMAQEDLAKLSGISLRTLKRLEAGENSSLETLLKVFNSLNLTERLFSIFPDTDVRPIERVKLKGRERQRASAKEKIVKASQWAWGDDEV